MVRHHPVPQGGTKPTLSTGCHRSIVRTATSAESVGGPVGGADAETVQGALDGTLGPLAEVELTMQDGKRD